MTRQITITRPTLEDELRYNTKDCIFNKELVIRIPETGTANEIGNVLQSLLHDMRVDEEFMIEEGTISKDFFEVAERLVSQLKGKSSVGWQPIETAPVGTKFIGLSKGGYPYEAYIPYAIAPTALDPGGEILNLTHWIPFPSLPK